MFCNMILDIGLGADMVYTQYTDRFWSSWANAFLKVSIDAFSNTFSYHNLFFLYKKHTDWTDIVLLPYKFLTHLYFCVEFVDTIVLGY